MDARTICAAVGMMFAAGESNQASAATQPRYGGTLVIELRAPTLVLDPQKWVSGTPEYSASEQIAPAVFDRLVTLDRFGRFQPTLATDWSHDEGWRRWQFSLRAGVQFSDGSALTAADVANALQNLLPGKPVVTAAGTHVVVQFPAAMPDLLEQLASGRYFIYRRNAGGTLLGTGAFFLAQFTPAANGTTISRYKFSANEKCWAGRPFVETIEVDLGVPALRQLFDLQLGKADVVELSADLVGRAGRENLRVWASAPVLLFALQVSPGVETTPRSGVGKADLREALSLALDRATMANVLLQRQAEPAASFLPQWLSGYAFVFGTENNVERAKEIGRALFGAPGTAMAPPLKLRVEAGGDLAKLIGDRVAINARQAGISVQLQTHAGAREGVATGSASVARTVETPGLRLIAWRYSSLSERVELDAITATLQLEGTSSEQGFADAEQTYARERRLLTERGLIPLVVMPEYIGLGAGVRDWMPERWGEWHLGDVWLDGKRNVSEGVQP